MNWVEICFCCFLPGGPITLRLMCLLMIFSGIHHSTIFGRASKTPKYSQIQPNTAKYYNWPVSGCAKYGWVGYPWKDHTKWSLDTLTSGQEDPQIQPNTAKYCNWPVPGRAKYGWLSEVSLKRSCKMQFRRVDLVSIRPPSQKLWPNQILVRRPHCNYNVKLEVADQKYGQRKER